MGRWQMRKTLRPGAIVLRSRLRPFRSGTGRHLLLRMPGDRHYLQTALEGMRTLLCRPIPHGALVLNFTLSIGGALGMPERFADLTREVPGLVAGQVAVPPGSPFAEWAGGTRVRVNSRLGQCIVRMAAGLVALGDPARTHFTMAAGPANASSLDASAQPQR